MAPASRRGIPIYPARSTSPTRRSASNAQLTRLQPEPLWRSRSRRILMTTATCRKSRSTPDGTGSIRKHYCMGRISHELVQVMPDERTVLMGDDATNGGAFMFIADNTRDLSAAARSTSPSGPRRRGPDRRRRRCRGSGSAMRPARRSSALVSGGIKAADIMDVKTADPGDTSYTKIPYSRQVQLDQGQARHGEGGGVSRNAPLRSAQGRQPGLHQDGKAPPSTPRTRSPMSPCRASRHRC